MNSPLVDKSFLLQKFPGKGGWTYAEIPEIAPDKHAHFGWVRVKGKIDAYSFTNFHLQPMGNGKLFFSVKSEIRKKIGKQAGDWVHITLYRDNNPQGIPEELMLCLQEDPQALEAFMSLSDGEKKKNIEWIYAAKSDDIKVHRIASMMDLITNRNSFQI
ncbi:MAG: DUF1905 domain-containing protein [Cyclobacteriaceae bacterium]|nr:DUF1905 domain-containing protein [Cyclobacteriaceae bacterium]